jgi:uncharacterized protein with HEPN domain
MLRLVTTEDEFITSMAWQEMAAAGNIYRHEYEDVAAREVWDTLIVHLPPLRAVVDAEHAALDSK